MGVGCEAGKTERSDVSETEENNDGVVERMQAESRRWQLWVQRRRRRLGRE